MIEKVRVMTFLVAAGLSIGCPNGEYDDEGADGSGGADESTGGAPDDELPGVLVECCYTLTSQGSAESGVGCTYPSGSPCIDPADPSVDQNGDKMLDARELAVNVCAQKCPSDPDDYPFNGPSFFDYDAPNRGVSVDRPYIGCKAAFGTLRPEYGSCDPSHPSELEPWDYTFVPPTHKGELSSSSRPDEAPLIEILGQVAAVAFDADIDFAVNNCTPVRGQRGLERCDVVFSGLDVRLTDEAVFGAYRVDSAHVGLEAPHTVAAVFTCSRSGCLSTFDLAGSSTTGISLDLDWAQTTLTTGADGGGSLKLSNAPDSIVRLPKLEVRMLLDPTKRSGTIDISAEVTDGADGSFVRSSFDISGGVQVRSSR